MSDARQAMKESMLVAADQYEADGEWWRADALRALARGDVLEVEVMPRSYGSCEMRLRLRLNADDEWKRRAGMTHEELEAMYGPRVFHP